MKRSQPLSRTPTPWTAKAQRKPRTDDPVTSESRSIVAKRSGGLCEVCAEPATHVHHRKLRRCGDHLPANLLHVCSFCHVRLHGHVRFALDIGAIVSQYDDPRVIPVLRRNDWVLLGDDGTLKAPPGATGGPLRLA